MSTKNKNHFREGAKVRKVLLAVVLSAWSVFAAWDYDPKNSDVVWTDSLSIDSTETEYTTMAWADNGMYKTLLIEAFDDTNKAAGGWNVCSSAVDIYVIQSFPVRTPGLTGYNKYIARLASKAHPDSTAMHPIEFKLFDSLRVADMDTAAVYLRNAVADTAPTGNTVGYHYGNTTATLQTTGFGAFTYTSIPYDYSPALQLKVTGKASNDSRGAGSRWRFTLYQYRALPVKGK